MKIFAPLATAVTLLLCLFASFAAQEPKPSPDQKPAEATAPQQKGSPAQKDQAPPATPKPALAFGLTQDTPVRLKLTQTMSSADAKVDQKVDFEVVEAVKIGEVVIIPQGGMAIATVTEAKPKGRMGKAGKLNMNIDYVQLASGEKVPLRAVKGGSGGSHTGAMTGAMVATGIIFFPAAPLFLFMHGKDITIPKGTEITAFIAADTELDPAKFAGKPATVATVTAPVPATATDAAPTDVTMVAIKSSPDGADITIDGKFVGTTPSTLQLKAGEHVVLIEKSGFKSWQRTMTVTGGGNQNIEATLDKNP